MESHCIRTTHAQLSDSTASTKRVSQHEDHHTAIHANSTLIKISYRALTALTLISAFHDSNSGKVAHSIMIEYCCNCGTDHEDGFIYCKKSGCHHLICDQCGPAKPSDDKKAPEKLPPYSTVVDEKQLPVVVEEKEIPTVVEEKQSTVRAEPKLDRDVPRTTKFVEHIEPIDFRSVARCEGNSKWETRRGHLNEGQNHVGNAALGEEESAGCRCVVL